VNLPVASSAVASLALLLHEFATNAAKYGSLSTAEGAIDIACSLDGDHLALIWAERGGPALAEPKTPEGFGAVLSRIAVNMQLGGEIKRWWKPEGLTIHLVVPQARLTG